MTYRLAPDQASEIMERVRVGLSTKEYGSLTVSELLQRYQMRKLEWLLANGLLHEDPVEDVA